MGLLARPFINNLTFLKKKGISNFNHKCSFKSIEAALYNNLSKKISYYFPHI